MTITPTTQPAGGSPIGERPAGRRAGPPERGATGGDAAAAPRDRNATYGQGTFASSLMESLYRGHHLDVRA